MIHMYKNIKIQKLLICKNDKITDSGIFEYFSQLIKIGKTWIIEFNNEES